MPKDYGYNMSPRKMLASGKAPQKAPMVRKIQTEYGKKVGTTKTFSTAYGQTKK